MLPLGKTARYLRERKRLTQVQAAQTLGITQVHLSNIENNKAIPSHDLMDRYRRAWGVDLHMLAWCLHGDVNDLPEAVRRPMLALASAWRQELGDVLDADGDAA